MFFFSWWWCGCYWLMGTRRVVRCEWCFRVLDLFEFIWIYSSILLDMGLMRLNRRKKKEKKNALTQKGKRNKKWKFRDRKINTLKKLTRRFVSERFLRIQPLFLSISSLPVSASTQFTFCVNSKSNSYNRMERFSYEVNLSERINPHTHRKSCSNEKHKIQTNALSGNLFRILFVCFYSFLLSQLFSFPSLYLSLMRSYINIILSSFPPLTSSIVPKKEVDFNLKSLKPVCI